MYVLEAEELISNVHSEINAFLKCKLHYILVSSNPAEARCTRYNIIHFCMIKLESDLWQVGGFLRVLRFPPPIKLTATI